MSSGCSRLRALSFLGLAIASVASAEDAAPRIVVVGTEAAAPVADALRVELDPLGFDVRVLREARVDATRLDLKARAAALERAAANAGAMGAAEVLLREDGGALLLYHSRVDGVTRSRSVPVSLPPTDQDHRSLALVLRSMIRGTVMGSGLDRTEELDALARVPAPAPRVRVRGRPVSRPDAAIEAAVGYAAWTRVGGDFLWHGPAIAARLVLWRRLALEGRAAISFEASARNGGAEVRVSDALVGLWTWLEALRTTRHALAAGAGVDGHRVVASGSLAGGPDDPSRIRSIVSVAGGAEWRLRLLGSATLFVRLTAGWATGHTTYTVRSEPVLTEGQLTTESAVGIGIGDTHPPANSQ